MRYLIFDYSDGDDGIATLEAMASTRAEEHPRVLAEAQRVLDWAHSQFPGRHGPVEDGQAWDHELLVQHEEGGWLTVTLTLSASAEFLEAFLAVYGEAED
ncbi:hypothetical protein ASC95_08230 [Pelomonas sp. Root1217]|uniref:hypothetical protein n=1 Tax=Pelomonas sp. Root1217 TaxID=1736430 RepID=UPI0007098ABB|nr:hypothetical protein [Pelomonas sp. Root1217]KQV52790.1 hypothetical protein ASC95_08230 [Pelomonas sp. Root1217]